MSSNRLLIAAAILALAAGFVAPIAAMAQTAAPPAKVVAQGDIMTTLRTSGQFTTLVKALDATNLSGLLQKQPNITVFAPTDAAFAALPAGDLDKMMADKNALQKLLIHHLINARIESSKFKGARGGVPSGAGDKIVLDGSTDGVFKADNATIVQADLNASNGLIQVVDHVMIAGSVPETLPEPPPAADPTPPAPEPAPAKPAKAAHKKK